MRDYMVTDEMRHERGRKTHAPKPSTRQYPTAMRVLVAASVAVLLSAAGGSLYGRLVLGIPIPDLNSTFLPIGSLGLLLSAAALAWKRRLDRRPAPTALGRPPEL